MEYVTCSTSDKSSAILVIVIFMQQILYSYVCSLQATRFYSYTDFLLSESDRQVKTRD